MGVCFSGFAYAPRRLHANLFSGCQCTISDIALHRHDHEQGWDQVSWMHDTMHPPKQAGLDAFMPELGLDVRGALVERYSRFTF
eukprot:2392368-Pyramimonas_sp.AAC.1